MDNHQALELLKEVVQTNTVLGNEKVLADKLEKLLKKYDFKTEKVEYAEGRSQLIVTYKGKNEGPVLGFSGHLDVVPVGEVDWEEDPFGAVEKDGKLYGRGSCDMKSGLISALVALIRLKESNTEINGTIKFLITAGEETSSVGADQLVELGYADDVDALIINEPTDLKVGIAHKGDLWPKITSYGKTSHGSMPEQGVNAINQLIRVINQFNQDERFDFTSVIDDFVGNSTSSLNIFQGGKGTNVVPDRASIEIDIRTLFSQDHEKIKADIADFLEEIKSKEENFDYDLEFINDLVAIKTDSEDSFTQLVQQAAEETLGSKVELFAPSYYTDGSKFVLSEKEFPIIIIGPGLPEYAHQPNEYVEVEKFYDMITINQTIMEKYLT